MNKNKGFTLIELLVVIAIIGILASLVLVALGNARDKANDARIKSGISQLRTLAETIYDNNGSKYESASVGVDSCFVASTANDNTKCTGANIKTSVDALIADIAAAGGSTVVAATGDSSHYCIESTLKSSTTSYFCADSTGVAKVNTAAKCTAATSAC
jgi:prepilin-type N-terminal cleavage/methylation domain-containing protein